MCDILTLLNDFKALLKISEHGEEFWDRSVL